jgi:LytR cell envelope-related transcriptional attenuator
MIAAGPGAAVSAPERASPGRVKLRFARRHMDRIFEAIQQIGAYAGFAALIGLAILAALYFSQSRDLRRLRDEGLRSMAPPAPPPPGQAAQRLQAQREGGVVPAPAMAAAQSPASTAVQPPAPAGARPATPAGAQAQGGPQPPARPGAVPPPPRPPIAAGRPPVRIPPRPPAAARRPLAPEPWYRNLEPRYLLLVLGGVLIIGGGAIFAIASLTGGDRTPQGTATTLTEGGGKKAQKAATGAEVPPLDPSQVTVAVLNGTAVPGLAAQVGDTVDAAGFARGRVDNAPDTTAAESVVLYTPGNEPAAAAVAKELDISQVGQVDAETEALAGTAQVVVVVGADQAP